MFVGISTFVLIKIWLYCSSFRFLGDSRMVRIMGHTRPFWDKRIEELEPEGTIPELNSCGRAVWVQGGSQGCVLLRPETRNRFFICCRSLQRVMNLVCLNQKSNEDWYTKISYQSGIYHIFDKPWPLYWLPSPNDIHPAWTILRDTGTDYGVEEKLGWEDKWRCRGRRWGEKGKGGKELFSFSPPIFLLIPVSCPPHNLPLGLSGCPWTGRKLILREFQEICLVCIRKESTVNIIPNRCRAKKLLHRYDMHMSSACPRR